MIKHVLVLVSLALSLYTSPRAQAQVQRDVKFEMSQAARDSGWSPEHSGLLEASDLGSYNEIVSRLSNGALPVVPRFEEGYHYFFVFGGKTLSGPGHIVEVKEVWREASAGDPRPGGRDNAYVHVQVRVREGALRMRRSPMIVVRVKQSDFTRQITGATDIRLFEERIRRNDRSSVEPVTNLCNLTLKRRDFL